MGRADDDLLAQCVLFLSSTESRSKLYRIGQYSAKLTKWTVLKLWRERSADPPQKRIQPAPSLCGTCSNTPEQADKTLKSSSLRSEILAGLQRVEFVFIDARKVYRLFQFLEMLDMLRHVNEPLLAARALRRVRIVAFFFFYLLENYLLLATRVYGLSPHDPRARLAKRGCNGFWCLSILVSFPLDHLMGRGSPLATLKKLLDLPVASFAFSETRVSDGIFSTLGLASAYIGVYLRWIDLMRRRVIAESVDIHYTIRGAFRALTGRSRMRMDPLAHWSKIPSQADPWVQRTLTP